MSSRLMGFLLTFLRR
uniref:Uncharacterized protein n=1 Tax=Rhizophora mucronata TaxID=61149 RepID=A0A2P2QG60_RHIMU